MFASLLVVFVWYWNVFVMNLVADDLKSLLCSHGVTNTLNE